MDEGTDWHHVALIPTTHPPTHAPQQVTDRRSIDFDEAGERLVMGSLAAFKGKDWRAVILLDCTEGVLPSKSSVHTTKEVCLTCIQATCRLMATPQTHGANTRILTHKSAGGHVPL